MLSILFWGIASQAVFAQVTLDIRFFDKKIYYVSEAPIFIQVTITNNTPSTYRFKLADDRSFSIDFDVRTMSNRVLEPAHFLIRRRSMQQQVFFREVSIGSGESFSFVEDVRNFSNLNQSGAFVVQARMYPELFRPAGGRENLHVLESNRLALNIRPPAIPGPDGIPLAMDVATNAVLVRERLPPDEVVTYLINARQRAQWERFFLYLDLESFFARDPVRQRQWLSASEESRSRMLARFRDDIRNVRVENDISRAPIDFRIERTLYTEMEGTVTVLERFRDGDIVERRRYTYYLERKDDIWVIVNYAVTHLGVE